MKIPFAYRELALFITDPVTDPSRIRGSVIHRQAVEKSQTLSQIAPNSNYIARILNYIAWILNYIAWI